MPAILTNFSVSIYDVVQLSGKLTSLAQSRLEQKSIALEIRSKGGHLGVPGIYSGPATATSKDRLFDDKVYLSLLAKGIGTGTDEEPDK